VPYSQPTSTTFACGADADKMKPSALTGRRPRHPQNSAGAPLAFEGEDLRPPLELRSESFEKTCFRRSKSNGLVR